MRRLSITESGLRSQADDSLTRLREAFRYIQTYPEGAPIVDGPLHARVVLGFPYSVLYEIVDGEILVTSVACHYRAPR